jgi:hypothetical protein
MSHRAIQRTEPPPEYGRDPRHRDGIAIMDRFARIAEIQERVAREAPRGTLGDGKRWREERKRRRRRKRVLRAATLFDSPAPACATLFEGDKQC